MPYNDTSGTTIETDAILSASSTLEVRPGVKAQGLHRDDYIWQWRHDVKGRSEDDRSDENDKGGTGDGISDSDSGNEQDDGGGQRDGNSRIVKQYRMGQDVCMGLLVPGVDTCVANGATLVRVSQSFSFGCFINRL